MSPAWIGTSVIGHWRWSRAASCISYSFGGIEEAQSATALSPAEIQFERRFLGDRPLRAGQLQLSPARVQPLPPRSVRDQEPNGGPSGVALQVDTAAVRVAAGSLQ